MNVQITFLKRATLQEVAEQHRLGIIVRERNTDKLGMRFYASFENAEVMEGGMLKSTYGNGDTPECAIANYTLQISGKRLAINADCKEKRKEIDIPILIQ